MTGASRPSPARKQRPDGRLGRADARRLEALPFRKQFVVRGAAQCAGTGPLIGKVQAFISARLPGVQAEVVDAVRMGPSAQNRVLFTVANHDQADAIVSARCCLKGSGATVFDVLSPMEQKLHDQLWPRFLEARAAGRKAQFSRAVLKIDDVRVAP